MGGEEEGEGVTEEEEKDGEGAKVMVEVMEVGGEQEAKGEEGGRGEQGDWVTAQVMRSSEAGVRLGQSRGWSRGQQWCQVSER